MSLMKWQFVFFGFHSNAGYISLNKWKGPQMDTDAQLEILVYREAEYSFIWKDDSQCWALQNMLPNNIDISEVFLIKEFNLL